jgi:hypothetical protein
MIFAVLLGILITWFMLKAIQRDYKKAIDPAPPIHPIIPREMSNQYRRIGFAQTIGFSLFLAVFAIFVFHDGQYYATVVLVISGVAILALMVHLIQNQAPLKLVFENDDVKVVYKYFSKTWEMKYPLKGLSQVIGIPMAHTVVLNYENKEMKKIPNLHGRIIKEMMKLPAQCPPKMLFKYKDITQLFSKDPSK